MAAGRPRAVTALRSGVALAVRLTPNARTDEIVGLEETPKRTVLKARVRAVPEKGRANAALVKLVAKWLGLPRTSVACVAGSRSRIKTIEIRGDSQELVSQLTERLGEIG